MTPEERAVVKRPPEALLEEIKTSLDRVFYTALDSIELVITDRDTYEKVRRRILREGNREFRRVADVLRQEYQVGYARRVEIVFDQEDVEGQTDRA